MSRIDAGGIEGGSSPATIVGETSPRVFATDNELSDSRVLSAISIGVAVVDPNVEPQEVFEELCETAGRTGLTLSTGNLDDTSRIPDLVGTIRDERPPSLSGVVIKRCVLPEEDPGRRLISAGILERRKGSALIVPFERASIEGSSKRPKKTERRLADIPVYGAVTGIKRFEASDGGTGSLYVVGLSTKAGGGKIFKVPGEDFVEIFTRRRVQNGLNSAFEITSK